MLTLIEGLEAGVKREELCMIDLSKVTEGGQQGAAPAYDNMLDIAEEVESKPQRGPSARQQIAKQVNVKVTNAFEGRGIGAAQPSKRESIKAEMRGIVSGLQDAKPAFAELRIKKIDTSELMLPNLPISDQIKELERIVSVLKENGLDSEQTKIARLELEGLQQCVKDLKDGMAQGDNILSELDRSLWDMREQRLDEALSLIEKGMQ